MNEEELNIKETDGIVVSACQIANDDNLQEYYLCVENLSKQRLKLLGKNWNITDEKGNVFVDSSIGFKGELPELESGEYFEMTAALPVDSKMAVCYGNCKVMIGDVPREIPIPAFVVSSDQDICSYN